MKSKAASKNEGLEARNVYLFLESRLYVLTGKWVWNFHIDELLCSDVMFAPAGEDFTGARTIVHPDDLALVKKILDQISRKKFRECSFRIITTYGKVETIGISGKVECHEEKDFLKTQQELQLAGFADRKRSARLLEEERNQIRAYQHAEKIRAMGIWTVNAATHEIFYSDGIFLIHGLPAQSLNAHLHTFSGFIHPEDRETVIAVFDKAYRSQVPVHLEYRLLLNSTETRYVQLSTRWTYNQKGEPLMTAVMEDMTSSKTAEVEAAAMKDSLSLSSNLLAHAENMVRMANWHMNLLTREVVYSSQIYRIYGLKQQGQQLSPGALLKYVHPDDMELVAEMNRQIIYEHTATDVAFRIVRPDGRIRYLRQKGKLVVSSAQEMIMIGTIVDVTDLELAEKKRLKLKQELELQALASLHVEALAGTGYWLWDIETGEVSWSNGFYELIGYKAGGAVQLSQRLLMSFIHPDDKKKFTDHVSIILQGHLETQFDFRLIRKGEIRFIQAQFRLVTVDDKPVFIAAVRDKTSEVQLEEQLKEQLGLAEMLSDASPDRVFVTDAHNYILKWNRRCEEDYGLKREKVIGKNFFEVFPQLKIPSIIENFLKAHRGETVQLKDQPSVVTAGFQNLLMTPVKDEKHHVVAVLTTIHDTTKEYRLKMELTQRLQFIEKLLEATVDRIIVLDRNMNYQYWNRKAEMYYGIRKEEVIGRNILELFPAFVDDPSYAEFRRVLKGETIHIPAVRNLEEKKGYFETYLIPVKDDKGEVSGILWIVHDLVGEHRLAQQQRRASRILESINEAYVEVDFEGRVRYMNARAEEFWNRKKEEVLGAGLLDLFPEAKDSGTMQALQTALKEKKDVRGEFFAPVAGRWVYLSCTVTDEGVIMLFYDITETKNIEQQVKEKQELLEATMNSSLDMIQVFEAVRNEAGEIIDFKWILNNHAAEKIYGDVIGKSLIIQQPGVIEEGIFETFKQVVETGVPNVSERHYVHEQFNGWYYQSAVKLGDGVVTTTIDITERKLAEQELLRIKDELARQVSKKYHELFRSIEQGFCVMQVMLDEAGRTLDCRFVEVSPSFEKQTGIREAVGKTLREISMEAVEFWYEAYGRVAKERRPERFEYFSPSQLRWWSVYAFPVDAAEQGLIGVLFNDITSRKNAEARQGFLLELNDALRRESDPEAVQFAAVSALGKHLGVGRAFYCEMEPDGDHMWIRRNYLDGVESQEGYFRISDFGSFLLTEYQAGRTLVVEDAAADQRLCERERFMYPTVDVRAFVCVPLVKNGQLVSVLAVNQPGPRKWTRDEIAIIEETAERTWAAVERARAEQALMQSEERLRMAMAIETVGVIYFNREGLIYDANPAFEKMSGYGKADLLQGAVRLEKITPPEFLEATQRSKEEYLAKGQNTAYEKQYLRRDGSRRWGLFAGRRLSENEFVEFVVDITESKEARTKLEELTARLEEQVIQRTSALEQNRNLLRSIFDASIHGIILFRALRDAAGTLLDYEIVLHNTETKNWNGRDLHGKWYAKEFPGIRENGLFEDFKTVLETGTPLDREVHYEGEGFNTWYRVTAVKLNEDELVSTAEDITMKKRAEEEIQKHLTLLRYTEYLSQTGNWEYEIATGNFIWSGGMYRLFGLPYGEKISPSIYREMAVEEDRAIADHLIRNLEKDFEPFEEIIRIRRGNDVRLLRVKGSVLFDENGKPQKLIGVDVDITEITQAEEKIREHRALMEQTAKASPDAITVYDLEKKQPVYLNNCLSEWTGFSNDELIKMGYKGRLQLIHPADRKKIMAFNEGMLSAGDGEIKILEYRLQTPKGLVWVRNRSRVFHRDEDGRPTHMLSVLQDFTEEMHLREQLMDRTRYAEAIIDASIDRIAVYDREFRVIAWNQRSEITTGVKKEQIIGKKLAEIFPRVWQDKKIRHAMEEAMNGQYAYLSPRKGVYTNSYYERYYIPLLNDRRETYAVLSIMHDVTNRVYREQELQELNNTLELKNAELEQKHEEITHFSFVASHDLKEPLRKIHTFSDWLLQHEKEQLSPAGKNYLVKTGSAVRRMELLIEEILVLTKIHSDKHKKENTNLNEVLEQVREDMADALRQTQTGIEAAELPTIKANANQVFYLFRNLISNAIKFQKPGNVPYIRIVSEIIRGEQLDLPGQAEEYMKISFIDNGFGFDTRYAQKIFQVFQRLHGKYEFEGTGIGLAICKKIMENHEGWIEAESEIGKGSIFNCYFPVA